MIKPKILVWDIETAHMVVSAFDLFNRHMLPYDNISKESYIICAAWRWLGEKTVHTVSVLDDPERFKADPRDDTHVMKTLYEVLSQADAVIHHYGDKFDYKKLNTRLIKAGGKPLPELVKIDTYKLAKNHFTFPSNRLDAIGKELGLGGKISTKNQLWLDCAAGIKRAIREMVAYNKQDVVLLEQVYYRLAPFAPAKLNANLFGHNGCPACGSERSIRQGYRYTRTQKYIRYQCKDCFHWYQGRFTAVEEGEQVEYK